VRICVRACVCPRVLGGWFGGWCGRSAISMDTNKEGGGEEVCRGSAGAHGVVRSWLFFAVTRRAGTALHNEMLRAVVAAPLWFFGANPTGRILNRFAKDQARAPADLSHPIVDC